MSKLGKRLLKSAKEAREMVAPQITKKPLPPGHTDLMISPEGINEMLESERKEILKAVEDLREHDHGFISALGVENFAKRFGVTLIPVKHYENLKEPKGLMLSDGPGVQEDKLGRYAYGLDAKDLAISVCEQLGVKYLEMFGRGSQLRACCDALQAHFEPSNEA